MTENHSRGLSWYAVVFIVSLVYFWLPRGARAGEVSLESTRPLIHDGDLAAQMVAGIGRHLDRALDESINQRARHWRRNLSSPAAYSDSVRPNRERLRTILGVIDDRTPAAMELVGTVEQPALVGDGAGFKAWMVRWPVLPGVYGEGLLLVPLATPIAHIVALPDCDQTPEALAGLVPGISSAGQFARRLAEAGFRVLVPTLIDRGNEFSAHPARARPSRLPHREYVHSLAYQMGRHIIGYEIQKVLAGVDWLRRTRAEGSTVGVVGYGEGGLVAFYAGAVDERIDFVGVSGYFQRRERVWSEPIYRHVWGLLEQFGDAEIATLIAPRKLIIEASPMPQVSVPPRPRETSSPHAPGSIVTPPVETVLREIERARTLASGLRNFEIAMVQNDAGPPGGEAFLNAIARGAGFALRAPSPVLEPRYLPQSFEPQVRMRRQFQEIVEHTQMLMRAAQDRRTEFWAKADASSVESWVQTSQWYRDYLRDEIIGQLPPSTGALNPRTRLTYDETAYRGYEVVLDVYPDVFTYGILLIPKDIKPGERRPVVVCAHGLEGVAQQVADPRQPARRVVRGFAAQLAQRGFITFAIQHPYVGNDEFRVLVRKAHPLKLSHYAFMVRQHERTLEWFAGLPFVDSSRIAYYGLSYGGKAGLRIGALLKQYAVNICSGDFNEWVRKTISTSHAFSYAGGTEYEMYEFDLANKLSHAEMSWLIFPRPFMVERGHFDTVGHDEWVAYEYARTFRHYSLLGLADRTRIEFFNGPHMIYGIGTFEFLHKHLQWPMRGY